VYLPPEQTNVLSNYSGEPTRLSKIGGQDFANAKQRVRRRLRELSFKLSELYSKRARVHANTYHCDKTSELHFANAFSYPLTPDQQKAVTQIEHDMSGNKIMDRLICGDVGFGKTEVAFRATFRAIMSGFQVAMLCPTTILSVQHYNTASMRFKNFGCRVEVLNRFKTDAEVKKILEGLRTGEVDLIIGTHRLLSSDIKYKNLGLLILDEEQRFGVGHKEKIKQLKNNIDVLTLSATPIPRTLNMALIGIRDISVITTPPVNRFPIITYVSEFSESLMLDAIMREKARGGQTIILFNDVSKIDAFSARLRKIMDIGTGNLTQARIGIIHGQMSEARLEQTIVDLYDRKIDVLIASTIIENGVDISTANTLVVIDSDKLGVAQMHQLRGRVGRGNTQAYAYFTYAYNKEISEIAKNRLDAIRNYHSSGAGMQIALKDLHLRGAGNILGANQSGHMEQIGFDMYCKILEEVARENRGEQVIDERERERITEPELDFALNCFIPHTYIESESERMKVYVAIAQINERADMTKTLSHLEDLYGKVPQEVHNIVVVGYIRALAKRNFIKHITHKKENTRIVFDRQIEHEPIVIRNLTIPNLIGYLEKITVSVDSEH
jgi:transcription-repair coupling factor (superfamily II helicase)